VGSLVDGSREALLNGQLGGLVDPTNHDSIITGIKRALAKPKAIPDGLFYFAWPSFQNRLVKAVNTLVSKQ
jgi:phosphatidylinositol alpha-1,6-mannosyltransferase